MANAQITMQQQLARSEKLNRERQQSRRNLAPTRPRGAQQQQPGFLDRLFDSREREGENLRLGEHDSKAKLLARRHGKKQLEQRVQNAGIPASSFMNATPQARYEPPLRLTTREGQAAQQELDNDLPEADRPRTAQDVDPTSVSKLKGQLLKLETRKKSARGNDDAMDEIEKLKEKQKERIRKAVKRKAEAAFKRGVIFVVDLIAGCFDLGSASISMLIDWVFYVFTFGWLNLELVYGRIFRGGKDIFISPLSWDPIPMPVDEEGNIIAGLLIAADLALLFLLGGMFAVGMCFAYDYYQFTEDPTNFLFIAAQGSTDVCTSDIISYLIGL